MSKTELPTFPHSWMCMFMTQSCPTLRESMDYSPPGFSVHGILQARILEWVVMPFSRGSSGPRDWIQVSRIAGRFFIAWATPEAPASFLDFLVLCLIFSFLLTVPQFPISQEQKLDSPISSSLLSANQLVSSSVDSDTISLFTVLGVCALPSFSLSHQSVSSWGFD